MLRHSPPLVFVIGRYARGQENWSLAKGKRLRNIAFAVSWQIGDARNAVDLLVDMGGASEDTVLVRTYSMPLITHGLCMVAPRPCPYQRHTSDTKTLV